jgi:alpha-mannosidase
VTDNPFKTITQILHKLRQLSQKEIQDSWRYSDLDLAINPDLGINLAEWQETEINEKGYLIWEAGQKVRWFAQEIVIPRQLNGYKVTGLTLRVALTWWAETAQIFINGILTQEGDLFDSSARVVITENAKPGDKFIIALRLVSPGHDIGGLMKSCLIYEVPKSQKKERDEPGFIADELTVLANYLNVFEPNQLKPINQELIKLDNNFFNQSQLIQTSRKLETYLTSLRHRLQPLAKSIKQRCFKILGHAHLDMAWLWEKRETWEVAQRTFTSVLNLQKDYPNLTFCHTSPALYEWVENNRPDLFKAIQQAVRAESWEILGGMWIEPEVNLISGESLIRQILYGQQYFYEKFEKVSDICWLTDSFGFPWQLPQILKQSGINTFVTQKLKWNDTTEFPYNVFAWQSPDGSQILGLMSPPNITGVMDTNPVTMTNYAINWEQQTGIKDIFWLPGVGDHGGGPTRDMLEVNKRWQNSSFFPKSEFTTARNYISSLVETRNFPSLQSNVASLPVWNDELYLELHRGCYTTHADQKWYNRRCEEWLYQAELYASLAQIMTGYDYPKAELETAWKQVLFNQFHDILPGTSIPPVFVEANENWEKAGNTAKRIIQKSLGAISQTIQLPPPPVNNATPIAIFNPLNWTRSDIVTFPDAYQLHDTDGKPLPSQLTPDGETLFLATDIPAVGYRVVWLSPASPATATPKPSTYTLENHYLRVTVDPDTGDLNSIFNKTNQKEILIGAGNQLQAFQDQGQYWDAWNIDPNYEQHPLPPPPLQSIQWREDGNLRQVIRIVRQLNNSTFTQDYILETHSPLLKIKTTVDWREDHVLVKSAFPLNLEADFASYEIACGTIQRTTKPQTPAEKAKWEVYAHRWADLTDNSQTYGVSLLNDCKYGYDAKPNQLRLTLLRSPKWTDPHADRGIHTFTYGIYPHAGTWQEAKTVHHGYEFNLPLQTSEVPIDYSIPPSPPSIKGEQEKVPLLKGDLGESPPTASFLNLQADNLILMALKPSEANPKTFILRCYEAYGKTADFALGSDLELTLTQGVDLQEKWLNEETQTQIKPWQIKSYEISYLQIL